LIAQTKDAPTLSAEVASNAATASVSGRGLDLPENGPVPSYRYTESHLETAYAASADSSQVVGKRALAATLKLQREAAVPQEDLTEQGDTGGNVDNLTTSAVAET